MRMLTSKKTALVLFNNAPFTVKFAIPEIAMAIVRK